MNIEQLKELINSYNTPNDEYHSITLFNDFSGEIRDGADNVVVHLNGERHLETLVEERTKGEKKYIMTVEEMTKLVNDLNNTTQSDDPVHVTAWGDGSGGIYNEKEECIRGWDDPEEMKDVLSNINRDSKATEKHEIAKLLRTAADKIERL